MNCPTCAGGMEDGWLATFNPLLWFTFVVWQATEPGYLRMFRPVGSEKVIVPRSGGRGCPKAQLCRACKTVVFSYAENQLALNVVTPPRSG
jgi:hypothetical protein